MGGAVAMTFVITHSVVCSFVTSTKTLKAGACNLSQSLLDYRAMLFRQPEVRFLLAQWTMGEIDKPSDTKHNHENS
jgi:hypothetical protein